MESTQFYSDENCLIPLEFLPLGVEPVGTTKTYEFYVRNVSRFHLRELSYSIDHPEVNIISAPVDLDPSESAPLVVEWIVDALVEESVKAKILTEGKKITPLV